MGLSRFVPSAAVGPEVTVPRYSVVAQRTADRPDRLSTFYVVVDPVDTRSDSFKSAIRAILQRLAVENDGPNFSASVFDNLAAAQTEVSYLSNPYVFSDAVLAARDSFNNDHLVASYVGGIGTDAPASGILLWFPEAEATAPATVRQWVSAEVWSP